MKIPTYNLGNAYLCEIVVRATMKLFISYRSLDSAKVDSIAAKLKAIEDENGQRIYSVWQDKHDIPDGHNWWDAIVDAIIDCDVFIFMVSKESCTSPICQAELRYAFLRNRPIVPIVLEDEYLYDAQTAKNDLTFRDTIPDELNARNAQFLFYEDDSFAERLAIAIKKFQDEPHRWKDKDAKRPVDPRDTNGETSDDVFDIYDMAVDYAYRMEFQTAERHFLRLMNSANDTFHEEADKWVDIVRAYNELKKFASRKSTEHRLAKEWMKYQASYFPVEFIDGIFDPFDMAIKVVHARKFKPDIKMILPAPFDLIKIPQGSVTIKEKTETVSAFEMAKYPVTNAQFARFIEAGGYENKDWWTDAGWEARLEGWYFDKAWNPSRKPWIEPKHWRDGTWNDDLQPVIGVSWYEAVAFCLWLSYKTGDKVMLPTEQQWQRAAQGDDERIYPWGNDWDSSRCNNNVDDKGIGKTTPVTLYEGKNKGNSYFGVVDMAGNVWEWCRTAYKTGSQNVNKTDSRRVRGGSWDFELPIGFRCDNRLTEIPFNRGVYMGFRFVRNF